MAEASHPRFIAFEGGEGAGKSTQVRLLGEALARRGIDHLVTREPGGTVGAEAIRALLLQTGVPPWGAAAEALLFAAARADHVTRLIDPALAGGRWVLCDRFIDSSRAYQGGASGLGDDTIMDLHRIGSGGRLPDLVILLTLDPALAQARVTARDGGAADRIAGRGAAYHARVAERFETIARAEPGRFAVIDGAGDPAAVHAQVLAAVDAQFAR
jgi:dTMP kinase